MHSILVADFICSNFAPYLCEKHADYHVINIDNLTFVGNLRHHGDSGLSCAVRPLETHEYPTKATRPAYSVLNKAKIRRDFGIAIPHWMDGLKRCIENLG